MAALTPTAKFYLSYSLTEARKHKCNTFLSVCSVFIVVIISALCYTLVDNSAVVFFRRAEQDYGQYDIKIKPRTAPFFNYSLTASILDSHSMYYHSPRFLYNNSDNFLFSTNCYNTINNNYESVYDAIGCSDQLRNNAQCSNEVIQSLAFWLIDFDKEDKMKFGRTFSLNQRPNANEIIITKSIAKRLDLNIGDMIYVMLPLNDKYDMPILQNYIHQMLDTEHINSNHSAVFNQILFLIETQCKNVVIPVKISMISSDKSLGGKFAERQKNWDVVMDIQYFMQTFLDNLPPMIQSQMNEIVSSSSQQLHQQNEIFSNRVYVNLGSNRVSSYLSTNYQFIQQNVVGYASKLSYFLGWIEIDIAMDLLLAMKDSSSTMLSLGVVLDIIIFVLIVLSILLLYSLIVINIASKTFTIGIFRMLGMSRKNVLFLLQSQSLTYALPSWAFGLIIAQIMAVYVLKMLGASSAIHLNPLLTATSIVIATIVGLGMSMVASILPIKTALSKTLQQSLNVHHSKTAAVKFNINRADGGQFGWSAFSICLLLVVFGWVVYYFFPQSIISGKLALFALMLMLLMLSILIGCILMGLNLQHLLERAVLFCTLSWWEKQPVPGIFMYAHFCFVFLCLCALCNYVEIVLKNLIAHKVRNRKTALMYAFSLSFIFFVTVMISTQLSVLRMNNIKDYGVKLFCWTDKANIDFENVLDSIDVIEDFSWKYGHVHSNKYSKDFHSSFTWIQNIGRKFHEDVWVFPTTPNFAHVVDDSFIVEFNPNDYDWKRTSLDSTQQLYTAYGSQRMLIGEHVSNKMHLNSVNDRLLLLFANDRGDTQINQYHKLMTAQWFKQYPYYQLISIHASWPPAAAVLPITAMPRLFNTSNGFESIEDAWITAVLIRFKNSVLNSEIDDTKEVLEDWCHDIKDYRNMEKQVAEASSMLDLIFSFMTYAALCLCLFSLVSSMFANIMEQSKEVGILRSMGLTKFEINKIYIYEALVIILSSSLLGFVVGYIVSFVIVQQQILFSQFPIELIIPSSVIFSVVSGALITSVASVYFPLSLLNKKQIANNLRDLSL